VVTVAALIFGRLLGGAVIVETLFSIPGLGRLLVSAISVRDFPVIQAVLIVIVAGFALLNLLTDLLYGRLDPRIRLT
jgi:ABC-type dipeptide/oligopeptide/nickel transport system permease component